MDRKPLTNKERMEMFQSGVSQLTAENDVSSVRDVLRQRYLKAKAEEEEKRKKEEEEARAKKAQEESKRKEIDRAHLGRQLARVFRFGSSNTARQRNNHQNRANRRPEVDPFDDPNVLMQNFAFDDDDDNIPHGDGHAFEEDDEDIDDDSFQSLVRLFLKNMTWARLAWIVFKLTLYITGQVWAYKHGFGAVFFSLSLLLFVCTNLRNKAPGELSAFNVFNPFYRHIPSTVGEGQPQDNIVLLGNL